MYSLVSGWFIVVGALFMGLYKENENRGHHLDLPLAQEVGKKWQNWKAHLDRAHGGDVIHVTT